MRATALLVGLGTLGCNNSGAPPAADAAQGCETPESCCKDGDAAACETAATAAGDVERRELWSRACDLGRAPACLRAAATYLGRDVDQAERFATRGCSLDSRAWIPGATGGSLSCAFFDRDTLERARKLSSACVKGEPGWCRALGDLLRPFDAGQAKQAWSRECRAGGIGGSDADDCLRFSEFLATPPSCPVAPRTTTLSYGRCPSDAKVPPEHLGRVVVTRSNDDSFRALVAGSQALKYCYAAGLVDAPKLAGRVRLAVRVDRRGQPFSVSTAGSVLGDELALECFVRQTAELRVSQPPAAPRDVVIELRLEP